MNDESPTLNTEELSELKWAHQQLEHPSFAARLSSAIGTPIELALQLLPKSWYQRMHETAEASIKQSLDIAVQSMDHISPSPAHNVAHKIMVMGSGAFGGFFGPLALLAELPVTTTIMLRSIADVAHSQGEDLNSLESRLACMEVFALGARSDLDDAADTGYYGLRLTLSLHFTHAILNPLKSTSLNIPAGLEFVRAITSRFGVVIADKAAAQAVPVAGAISGALLNLIFMQHFQDVAKGHFIIRRLERKYSSEYIKAVYDQLSKAKEELRPYSNINGW